ncbi:hypothetical protein [Arthrobacter sp. NPDC092385]|uniref:hypothetical protein n=1 Tax=Arthrobacter sp. NPDC092385 TaxID=3363943 RepID=UPI0037FD2A45
MPSTTLSSAGQLVDAAIARRDDAQAQAAEARRQADAARSAAATLEGRLRAGDSTVNVEELVKAGPAADRLAALADAYAATLPSFEAAIRQAHTDELLERISSGQILSREAYSARVADLVQKIADFMEPLELALEPVAKRHLSNVHSLTHTTAYGSGFNYRNGNPRSPIRIGPSDMSFDVDGTTYVMDLSLNSMMDNALSEAQRELSARRTARASAQ